MEFEVHLFMRCEVVKRLWCLIFKWLGLVVMLPNNLTTMSAVFYSGVNLRKRRMALMMIWHSLDLGETFFWLRRINGISL